MSKLCMADVIEAIVRHWNNCQVIQEVSSGPLTLYYSGLPDSAKLPSTILRCQTINEEFDSSSMKRSTYDVEIESRFLAGEWDVQKYGRAVYEAFSWDENDPTAGIVMDNGKIIASRPTGEVIDELRGETRDGKQIMIQGHSFEILCEGER